jgi:hypothetical protein
LDSFSFCNTNNYHTFAEIATEFFCQLCPQNWPEIGVKIGLGAVMTSAKTLENTEETGT